jgi:hypothetical protein
MFHQLVPRRVLRLWNEASVWRWRPILAVLPTGMLLIAPPPATPPPLDKAPVPGKLNPQATKNAGTVALH